MSQNKNVALKSLCAEPRPDDGVSPNVLKRQKHKQNKNRLKSNHRALQYCKAAQRSLDGALAGIGGDESMNDLSVVSVEPVPGGCVLLVVSAPSLTQDGIAEIEQHLQQVSGLLRAAIAGDTHRKRVPQLRFRVVPADH